MHILYLVCLFTAGSPVLDIKPYVPFCDSVPPATAPQWVAMRVRVWVRGGAGLLPTCAPHRRTKAIHLQQGHRRANTPVFPLRSIHPWAQPSRIISR